MLAPTLPIRTDRLTLRAYQADDLDDLHATHSDPDVVRHLFWDVRDRAGTAEALERKRAETVLREEGDELSIAVVWNEIDTVIGEVNLFWRSVESRQGELGYVFNPAYHGRGLATEAAVEVLRLGFDAFGLHRMFGRCSAANRPSAALMERLGMRLEARFRENQWFKGGWAEELVYAMLASEWRASRD